MGRGSSKAGGGGKIMDYDTFMGMDDEQKTRVIEAALISTKVPRGIKDTPTMRVMVALGIDNKPKMVDEETLDSMKGKPIYRTVTDEFNYRAGKSGKKADAIVKEFTTGKYSSMSDQNGSSEGRGYYFAKNLDGATFWGANHQGSLTMRAKVRPGTKLLNVDEVFYGGPLRNKYIRDTKFHDMMRTRNVTPWDSLSIWAISKGYKGMKGTDSGTGAKEIIAIDRGILSVSKTVKKIPKTQSKKKLTWKMMEE